MWIICRKRCGAFQLMQLHICCGCSIVWLLALFCVYCPENQHRKLSSANSYANSCGHSSFLSWFRISSATATTSSEQLETGVKRAARPTFFLQDKTVPCFLVSPQAAFRHDCRSLAWLLLLWCCWWCTIAILVTSLGRPCFLRRRKLRNTYCTFNFAKDCFRKS